MQTIGERLEEARKKKGISIREAAEATKIRGDYLQKFESNHFDIGLTELYTRGFLRNYANFLKVPSERLLADFAALGLGEARPRQPSREIYGRMDISVATAGEPSDRAAPPDDAPAEPAPARAHAQPRYPRAGNPNLPSGPDPALIFKYAKWAGIGVIALVAILIAKSLISGSKPAATTPPPAAAAAPATSRPAAPEQTFSLVALDVVRVTVLRKFGETEGEEVFSGNLSRGETKVLPWDSAFYIRATQGDNLKIEIRGKRYDTEFHGYGKVALPEPQR